MYFLTVITTPDSHLYNVRMSIVTIQQTQLSFSSLSLCVYGGPRCSRTLKEGLLRGKANSDPLAAPMRLWYKLFRRGAA